MKYSINIRILKPSKELDKHIAIQFVYESFELMHSQYHVCERMHTDNELIFKRDTPKDKIYQAHASLT